MKKVICPECGCEMELYGVFETGEYKYYCNNCHRMLNSAESFNLGEDKGERECSGGK